MKQVLKNNKLGIVLLLVILVSVISFNQFGVSAKEEESTNEDELNYLKELMDGDDRYVQINKTACDKDRRENCTLAASRARYKINAADDEKARTTTLTANKGTFTVYVKGNGMNDTHTLTAGTPLKIQFPSTGELDIVISVILKENDKDGKYCRAGCYAEYFTYTSEKEPDKMDNINYNGKCLEYRNLYNNSAEPLKSNLREMLPYCFQEKVDVNYPESTLDSIISSVRLAAEAAGKTSNKKQESLDTTGYTKVDPNKTNLGKLVCDAFKPDNINVKKYYTEKNISNYNNIAGCTATCKERLTIEYDAPQTAKAGNCFTYTVKIKSKAVCNAKYTKSKPDPSKYQPCKVTVRCTTQDGKIHTASEYFKYQGGPNEDFDECVNSCDNGKYSQKCINKCYKKVYKKSKIKLALDITDVPTTKVAKDSNCPPSNASARAIYLYKLKNPGGKYYRKKDGSIAWVYDESYGSLCESRRYGRMRQKGLLGAVTYYQLGEDYINQILQDKTVKKSGRALYGYEFDERGIRVRAKGCNDVCKFVASCPSPSSPLNAIRVDNENGNTTNTTETYEQALAKWMTNKSNCEATAKCETKTSTFKMEVDVDKNKTIKFDNGNTTITNSDGKTKATVSNPDNIIRDYGGTCYGSDRANSDYDYMTKINFPGAWSNKKDDTDLIYKDPKSTNKYEKKGGEGEFCLSPIAPNVNTSWWVWNNTKLDNNGVRTNISEKAKSEITSSKNLTYNIRAYIRNFGLFGWNADVSCFFATFAVSDGDDPGCTTDTCSTCISGSCKTPQPKCNNGYCPRAGDEPENTTNPLNVNIKTIATDDVIPSATALYTSKNNVRLLSYDDKDKGILKIAEVKDQTPYNWSCNATNLNNKNYQVAPTVVINHIENISEEDLYSDKYLDYSFTLNKETLATINNYSSSNFGVYNTNSENPKLINGVNAYSSSLISNIGGRSSKNKVGVNNNYIASYADACTNSYNLAVDAYKKMKVERVK